MIGDHPRPSSQLGLAMIFGPPGDRIKTAGETLQSITRSVLPECKLLEVNSLGEWDDACSAGEHFIAISQYPSPQICTFFQDSTVPTLIVGDDPSHAVAFLAPVLDSEIDTFRAVSASYSCLAGMMGESAAGIQSSNTRSVQAFLTRLAEMNGIQFSTPEIARVEKHASELTLKLSASDLHGSTTAQRATAQDAYVLAEEALPRLGDKLAGDGFVQVIWPGSMFLLGDYPGTWVHEAIDLAGPARCLLYGPYMHLPKGNWIARLLVAIGGDHQTQSFTIEIVCNEVIGRGRFCCQGRGAFEVRLDFVHHQPHVPLEIRLFLDVGAIDGTLNSFEVALEGIIGKLVCT